jgi:hypothetical protein
MYRSSHPSTSVLDVGGWSMSGPSRYTPGKDPAPNVQEAGWAPGTVWTGTENLNEKAGCGTTVILLSATDSCSSLSRYGMNFEAVWHVSSLPFKMV